LDSTNKAVTKSEYIEKKKISLWSEIHSLNSITTDSFAIHVTADTIRDVDKSVSGKVNSFHIDLDGLKIMRAKEWNKSVSKSKFEVVNDTIFILNLKDKNIIRKKLKPTKNGVDSVSYLGYLSQLSLFIFVENVAEYGPDYSAIDAASGQIINGIPLYTSQYDNLFGSVLFRHYLGQLEVPVKIWQKEDKIYRTIYEDEIVLTSNYNEYDRFMISDVRWDKKDFKFKLHIDSDSIELRLRVIGI
jgi:hypothetical protein